MKPLFYQSCTSALTGKLLIIISYNKNENATIVSLSKLKCFDTIDYKLDAGKSLKFDFGL
jgi:hypothetical protein